VADMLIVIYLAGWLPVSFATYAAGRRLSDRQTPANQPMMVMVSVAAGAVWPLLVVGLVEMSSVMVLTKVPSKPRQSVANVA
jgi:hypothetical protein